MTPPKEPRFLTIEQKLEGACAALHNIRNFPHLPHNRDLTFSEALDEVVSLASRALVEIGAIPQEKTNV